MKKIFAILLLCFSAVAYANDSVIFKETEENHAHNAFSSFSANVPVFIADEPDPCCTCPAGDRPGVQIEGCKNCPPHKGYFGNLHEPKPAPQEQNCLTWRRFSSNFGMENVYLRFPRTPTVVQSADCLTAYATDWNVNYSLTGYFPPISRIDGNGWFSQILTSMGCYPFTVLNYSIFPESNSVLIMDCVVHDCVQDTIIKSRTVVTPYNGYTIKCTKPYGASDEFDYFVDNFFVRVE